MIWFKLYNWMVGVRKGVTLIFSESTFKHCPKMSTSRAVWENKKLTFIFFFYKWSKLAIELTQVLARGQKGVTPHWVLWKIEIVHSFSDIMSENIALNRYLFVFCWNLWYSGVVYRSIISKPRCTCIICT